MEKGCEQPPLPRSFYPGSTSSPSPGPQSAYTVPPPTAWLYPCSCPGPAVLAQLLGAGSLHPMSPVWPWAWGTGEEASFLSLTEPSSSQGVGGLYCGEAWCLALAFALQKCGLGQMTIVNTRRQPGHPSVACQPCALWARACNEVSRELLIFLGSINLPRTNSKNATYT